jgi:hypothetical protein
LGNLAALSTLLFTFNLLAATQDISVDSLAVHALLPEELGAGRFLPGTNVIIFFKLAQKWANCFIDF